MGIMTVYELADYDVKNRPKLNVPWVPDIMAMYSALSNAVYVSGGSVTECMIAAIARRETNFQNILQVGVPPGPGCGVGPCQITTGVDWSDPRRPRWPGVGEMLDVENNFYVAIKFFLQPAVNRFPDNHQAAFDAYNLGSSGVQGEQAAGESPDALTTGGDYGRDVFKNWVTLIAASIGATPDFTGWKPQ